MNCCRCGAPNKFNVYKAASRRHEVQKFEPTSANVAGGDGAVAVRFNQVEPGEKAEPKDAEVLHHVHGPRDEHPHGYRIR